MPLGFKLRKPHMSYDVLSKNLFGVTVELLDNSQLECSLNTDSTGQDCVEHVCQRLGIEEADYFGMKFVNTRLQYQWLDPDQPVKVQLERHAQDPTLYFAVQFYVQSIYQVQDEMARHQVYLQLRHDVIEGKLVAQPGIAIMLAAYMLQATRGDYDPQQQTMDLLRNELLLPNNMMLAGGSNSNNNENTTTQQLLLRNVAEAHEQLRGMPPALAKLYYIVEAQKLEGYGDESFAAKDASGNDLLLAHNLSGIYIFRIPHSRPFLTMRWHDLKAVGQNKKAIGLECVGSGRASSRMMCVYMEDVESARYLAKMIELQQEFRTAMAEIEQQQQQQTEAAAPNQPQTNNNSEQQQHHNQRMQQQRDDQQQTNMPNANALSPSSNLLLATGASSSLSASQAAAAVGGAHHPQQRYNQQQQQQYYSHYPGGTSSAGGGASALLLNGNNNFDANRFSSGGTYTENQQYFIGSNFYPTPSHHQQQQYSSVSNAPPTLHARQQQNLYSGSVLGGPPNRAELYANVSAPPAFSSNKNNNNIDAVVGGTAIYRPNQNFQQQHFYQSYDNQALQQQQQQQQVVAANRPPPSSSSNVKPAKRTETNSSSNATAHQQHTSSKNYHIPANNSNVTAAHSSHAQNNQHNTSTTTTTTDELQHASLTYFTANSAKVLRAQQQQQRQPHYSSSDQKLQQTQQLTSSTAASLSSTSTPTPASYVYQQARSTVAENDENDDPLVHYFDQQHVDAEVIVSAQDGKNLPQPRQKSSVDSTSSSETNFGGSIASSSAESSSSNKKPRNVIEPNFNVNFAPPKPSKTTTPSPSKQPARNANAPSVNFTPSKRSRTPPGETIVAEQQQQVVVDAAICDAVSTEIAAAVTTNDPYYYYEDYTEHQPNIGQFQISAVDAQQHYGSDSRALNDVADYFAPIPIGTNLFQQQQQQFHAPVSPPFAEPSQCLAYTASFNSDTPNMLADGGFVVNHVSSSKNNNAAASSRLKQPRNVVPRAAAAAESRTTSKSQPHGRANGGGGGGGPSTTVSNGHVNANFDDDDNLLWSVADDAAGQLPHHQSSDDDMMASKSRRPRHENFAVVEHNSAAATNHHKPQQHNTRSQRPKTEFDDVVDSFYSSQPIVTAAVTVVTTSTTDRPANAKSKMKPTAVVDALTPVQSTEQLLVDNNAEQFVVMKSSARSSSKIKQPIPSAGAAAIKPSREVRSDLPAPAAEEEAAELFASRAALPPQSKKRISADSLDDTVVAQKPPSYTQTSSTVSTQSASMSPPTVEPDNDDESYYPQRSIGPMQLAEMTGLTLSRMRLRDVMPNIDKNSNDAAIAQLLLLDAEHTHQMSQSATAISNSSSSKRPGSSTLTRSSRRLSSGSPISTYMRRRRQKTGSSAMAAQSAVLPAAALGTGRSLSTTRPVSTIVPETQKNGGLLLADGSSALAKYQTMPSKKLDTQRLSSSTSTSPPPLVTVEDRIMRHLKQRLQITHMLSEFAQLPRKRIHKCVCAVAQLPENVHRNAQQLAVPYDDTRIQIARTSENSQGYINATDIILSAPSGSAITTITSSSSTANTPPNSAASSMSINHSATATMTPPSIAGKHHFALNNSNNPNGGGQLGITPPYERCYIATQTPLPNTVDDFYHMLWRYDVRIVVQLDGRPEYYDETNDENVAEANAVLSTANSGVGNAVQQHQQHKKFQQHPYLPQLHKKQHARTQKAAQYGPFIVKRLSTSHCREGWTTTTLQIECTDPNLLTSSNNVMPQPVNTLNSKSGSRKTTESPRTNSTRHLSATRNLVHFSFNAWPRNSPTAMPDAKSFVMFMREVATFYRDASPTQPPLLHCMNGCGRTGVAILFDFASQCLDREILVDIPRVLNHMRIQRPYMVPHARLYRLCFEALKEHYCSDRLI